MKLVGLANDIMAGGENTELIQDVKRITVNTINDDMNCGYDRAEITARNIISKIADYLKEKEII